jgi:hypothetical protein
MTNLKNGSLQLLKKSHFFWSKNPPLYGRREGMVLVKKIDFLGYLQEPPKVVIRDPSVGGRVGGVGGGPSQGSSSDPPSEGGHDEVMGVMVGVLDATPSWTSINLDQGGGSVGGRPPTSIEVDGGHRSGTPSTPPTWGVGWGVGGVRGGSWGVDPRGPPKDPIREGVRGGSWGVGLGGPRGTPKSDPPGTPQKWGFWGYLQKYPQKPQKVG